MECIPALPGILALGAGILWHEWLHGCDELTRSNVVLIEKCTVHCSSVIHHRAEESHVSLHRGVSLNANVDRFRCAHLTHFLYSFWFWVTLVFGLCAALVLAPGAQKPLAATCVVGHLLLAGVRAIFSLLWCWMAMFTGKCLDASWLEEFGTTTYGGLFCCSNKTLSNFGWKWTTATFSGQLVLFKFLIDSWQSVFCRLSFFITCSDDGGVFPGTLAFGFYRRMILVLVSYRMMRLS